MNGQTKQIGFSNQNRQFRQIRQCRQVRQTRHHLAAWVALLVILSMVSSLAGCSGSKLASSFDEQTVKQTARTVIEKMNSGSYESISNDMVREDLKSALSAKVLSGAADQILKDVGAFDSFANEVVVGAKDKNTGEDYATAVMVAKYANKKITYTISFDTKMKVVGFYLK